jgi:hypothetical protein
LQVAILTTFRANKKEPLAVLLERIHTAFTTSELGEPALQFSFSDAPVPGFVSSVDRVLKRHPDLRRFLSTASALPGGPAVQQLSNGAATGQEEPVAFSALLAVAGGVPRSFPFHNVSIQFQAPAFGSGLPLRGQNSGVLPGIAVRDSWWVNGRERSVIALTGVEADPASRKLPAPSGPVAAVLAACGKAKSTVQVPFIESPAPGAAQLSESNPEAALKVAAVVRDYRAAFSDALDRAALPHDLPPAAEALTATPFGQTAGPKKPVLVRAFKPMGYDCNGGSGTFTLRRRTAGNLTVQISLDVGTWSHNVIGSFAVVGPSFKARLPLPVSRRAAAGQYPIGEAERWRQIVDNFAALVAEFDRSFVPLVETASGPAPAWYNPES